MAHTAAAHQQSSQYDHCIPSDGSAVEAALVAQRDLRHPAPPPQAFHSYSATPSPSTHHRRPSSKRSPTITYYAAHLAPPHSLSPSTSSALSCDIKPRLTKEQHELLEAHFQRQSKPSTETKEKFAVSLCVPVDKVKNWFQNRRAKSKQDARRASALQNLGTPEAAPACNGNSTASPISTSASSGASVSGVANTTVVSNSSNSSHEAGHDQFGSEQSSDATPMTNTATDRPDSDPLTASLSHRAAPTSRTSEENLHESHRRTLTQEQFDALAHAQELSVSPSGHLANTTSVDDQAALRGVFPGFPFAPEGRATDPTIPLTANSTLPESFNNPHVLQMAIPLHDQTVLSGLSSDREGSRSSSVSLVHGQGLFKQPSLEMNQNHALQPQEYALMQSMGEHMTTPDTMQTWRGHQDFALDQHPTMALIRPSAQSVGQEHWQQQGQPQLQQLQRIVDFIDDKSCWTWPRKGALLDRRESQSSVGLARQFDDFGPESSQKLDDPACKTPVPTSIASRRQTARPAPLELIPQRSQSFSGAAHPRSPTPGVAHLRDASAHSLRRIRSNTVVTGVAPGRVTKSSQGLSQRSPLAVTFAEALQSPKAMKHTASTGSPMTTKAQSPIADASQPEMSTPLAFQMQPWSAASGQVSRQASISETSAEHDQEMAQPLTSTIAMSALTQDFSSLPDTPMYITQPQQQCMQSAHPHLNFGCQAMSEITPPQSAPATQQAFPGLPLAMQQPKQSTPSHQPLSPRYNRHPFAFTTQIEGLPILCPLPEASKYPMGNPNAPGGSTHHLLHTYAASMRPEQNQQRLAFATSGLAHPMPSHLLQDAPIIDDQDPFAMDFATHMPAYPFMPLEGQQPLAPTSASQMSCSSTRTTTPAAVLSYTQPPRPKSDFLVHEYHPPQPSQSFTANHRSADSLPKNYTFANHGPQHFDKRKAHYPETTTGLPGAA